MQESASSITSDVQAWKASLRQLRDYVESNGFYGYDPYDALNGWVPFGLGGRWAQAIYTQIHKRNPINLRSLIGIRKGRNPKAIGLFLTAYSELVRENPEDRQAFSIAKELFEWLLANRSKGFPGSCWGYNFDWVNPNKKLPAWSPSVVVTAFVVKGIWEYFHATDDERAKESLIAACDYVLEALPRTETDEGVCFSYTHLKRDCCYNANMLGAEILAIGSCLTGNGDWRKLAVRAMDFTLAHQKDDGLWNYARDWETGKERPQSDFHQGFVLDSIDAVARNLQLDDKKIEDALTRGGRFFKDRQFFSNGRSKWRLPKEWPTEIHNQAQGILTFTRLRRLDPEYLPFAERIALWTIENMQDRRGYFYYHKHRWFTNRIPYMRWAQAWMFLALVELSRASDEKTNRR